MSSRGLRHPLRRNQLHRLPGLSQHLEKHLGLGLEQGDPMLQIGGMALQLTADLQPIAQEHRSQLSDQLLSGITGLAKGATEIALEARGMAGGMHLLMGPGGIEGRWSMKAGSLRQLDAIKLGQIEGPIAAKADRHRPGGEHGLCRG